MTTQNVAVFHPCKGIGDLLVDVIYGIGGVEATYFPTNSSNLAPYVLNRLKQDKPDLTVIAASFSLSGDTSEGLEVLANRPQGTKIVIVHSGPDYKHQAKILGAEGYLQLGAIDFQKNTMSVEEMQKILADALNS